jgi:lysophospholipase L1-like esterase
VRIPGWVRIAFLIVALAGCGPMDRTALGTTIPACAASGRTIGEAQLRFLALGDSYTIGQAVAADERWPEQLASRLRAQGLAVDDPTIIAQTGWTTDELARAIDAATPQGPFELVSLLIGVNNQYRGLGPLEYRDEFEALLRRAIAFAGGDPGRVVVLSIPDWGVTPFAAERDGALIGSEIDLLNTLNAEVTARLGAAYVDVTLISRQAAHDHTLVAEDGLHPSGKMYALWAEAANDAACAALAAGGD